MAPLLVMESDLLNSSAMIPFIQNLNKKIIYMITIEEVKQLSRLCRIKFSENETSSLVGKLQNVIGLIQQLQGVNTDGIEPLTSVVDASARTREDKVTIGNIDLFTNVPGKTASLAKEIKCFIVPKVVE